MKKKVLVLLVVALLVPAGLFANILGLQLGAAVGYNMDLDHLKENIESGTAIGDYFALERFTFAPELKLNVLFIQADILSNLSFGENYFRADTQATAGLHFTIADVVKLGVGAGISTPIIKDGDNWTINGQPMGNFVEAMKSSRMLYKATVGFNLSFMDIALNMAVPAGGTFNEGDFMPDFGESTFNIAFLINLLNI